MRDRRHFIRWQINTKAKLRLEGAVADITCNIIDLSFSGARICLALKLPQDAPLKIKISLSEGFNFKAEIWVAWHRRIMDKNVYGVYFNRIKDSDKAAIYKFMYRDFPDVLKASGGRIPPEIKGGEEEMANYGFGLGGDRRVFARIPAALPVRLMGPDTNQELEATTCDVSAKGVGIVCRQYLKPGDNLELWLNIPDKKEPFYTRGAVVWTELQENNECRAGICLEKAEFMGMSRIFRA